MVLLETTPNSRSAGLRVRDCDESRRRLGGGIKGKFLRGSSTSECLYMGKWMTENY